MASETEKYRHLTVPYCQGNGIDIGSGGDPVVPNAIQVELQYDLYHKYRSGDVHGVPIQWHGDCWFLPFKDSVLDFVYSSHLIEDFDHARWPHLFKEWGRCLKPDGYMVILVPEFERWNYAIRVLGQPPNCAHFSPEPRVGELSEAFHLAGLSVIKEHLTECHPNDYTILGVAQKVIEHGIKRP